MDINKLQSILHDSDITVMAFIDHGKASECYVHTRFRQADGFEWETYVPYVNRRAALFIDSEIELAAYLKSIKPFFAKRAIRDWSECERKKWEESKADVTKEFFYALLSFRPVTDFPENDNPARRIQDIKDAGYTIATLHHYIGRKSARILLPLPISDEMGYETFTPQFKARVIRLLHGINAYEGRTTTPKGLIPDHKFSEIRWDKDTKAGNPMDMTDDEIIKKFQLLDNQRNQQKREVCRRCFQEGRRGVIFGLPYFYAGSEQWDPAIPAVGKNAEQGCIGCGWYDIEEWRRQIIGKLNEI